MTAVFSSWFLPVVLSALVLGFYDVAKKHAVSGNAVLPVLLISTVSGFAALAGVLLFSGRLVPALALSGTEFFLVFLKAILVGASWVCVYAAMRTLPISIAGPVRASAPLWILLGGITLYNEVPSFLQGVGMLLIFVGYYAFVMIGRLEGFSFRHKAMVLIFSGTLLGALSALYDKYLLGIRNISPVTLQLYFSLFLALQLTAVYLMLHLLKRRKAQFVFRWSIVLTGVLLVIADFLYFYALSRPDVKISILSLIRRSGCVVSFAFGAWYFRDRRIACKAAALCLILAGVFLLWLKTLPEQS